MTFRKLIITTRYNQRLKQQIEAKSIVIKYGIEDCALKFEVNTTCHHNTFGKHLTTEYSTKQLTRW